MLNRKMSSRVRAKKIMEAWDLASTPEQTAKVLAVIPSLSWDETRDLVKAIERHDYERAPWLLTTLVNLQTKEDIATFREDWSGQETDKSILNLRDELRQVWGRSQRDIESKVKEWFDELLDGWNLDDWLVLPELGMIRPHTLVGIVARSLFQLHTYCFTCSNPACNGTRFVASRKDQKYCLLTEECAKYGHRAAARRHYRKTASKTPTIH
jgi:hypothetical protein